MSLTSSLNSSSDKNHGNEVSHTSSPTTSSKDVFSTSIEQGDVFLCSEDQNFVNICNGLSPEPGSQSLIYKSDYAHIGNTVHLNVEHANINIQEKTSSQPAENAPANRQPSPTSLKELKEGGILKRHYKCLIILTTSITLVCAIVLIVLKFVASNNSDTPWTPTISTAEASTPTIPTEEPWTPTMSSEKPWTLPTSTSDPYRRRTFSRADWGARAPSRPLAPIEKPVDLVIIKHTKTETCHNTYTCFAAMRKLQFSDVGDHGLPDIRYNFVVCGDGNVYEGRGWHVQNEQMKDTIDIAFMGDFNVDVPSEYMVGAGPWQIVKGMFNGYLQMEGRLKVVCHNQTEDTDSPGENLFREVVKWTYYSPVIIR